MSLAGVRAAGGEDPRAAAVAHRRRGRAAAAGGRDDGPRCAGSARPRRGARCAARRYASALALVVARSGWSRSAGRCWSTPTRRSAAPADAPWLFVLLLPLLLAVVLAEIADGGMDAKAVALLGVLAAVGAALRPLGGGAAGFEPVFFLLVAGRAGVRARLRLRARPVTLFAAALLTGGVGPWLPFQMLARGLGRLLRRLPAAGQRAGAEIALLGGLRGRRRAALRRADEPLVLAVRHRAGQRDLLLAGAPVIENLGRSGVHAGDLAGLGHPARRSPTPCSSRSPAGRCCSPCAGRPGGRRSSAVPEFVPPDGTMSG